MVTQMQVPPFLRDVWVIFVCVNHIYVAHHPCIHANALVFWFAWTFLTKYLLNNHQFSTHMVTQIQVPPFLRDNRVIFMYMSHIKYWKQPCIPTNTQVCWFVWNCPYELIHRTGPLWNRLQLVLDQSLHFPQTHATTTGLITRGLGPQPQSGLFLVQSSSVCGLFAVLGPDF